MTVNERLSLLEQGFSEVVYYEVECKRHGAYRVAQRVDLKLEDRSPCPRCGRLSPAGSGCCFGFTKRPLPWSEHVSGTAAGLNYEGSWADTSPHYAGRKEPRPKLDLQPRRLANPREREIMRLVETLARLDKLRRGAAVSA